MAGITLLSVISLFIESKAYLNISVIAFSEWLSVFHILCKRLLFIGYEISNGRRC